MTSYSFVPLIGITIRLVVKVLESISIRIRDCICSFLVIIIFRDQLELKYECLNEMAQWQPQWQVVP